MFLTSWFLLVYKLVSVDILYQPSETCKLKRTQTTRKWRLQFFSRSQQLANDLLVPATFCYQLSTYVSRVGREKRSVCLQQPSVQEIRREIAWFFVLWLRSFMLPARSFIPRILHIRFQKMTKISRHRFIRNIVCARITRTLHQRFAFRSVFLDEF